MKYVFNYASIEQFVTDSDIETRIFDSFGDLLQYYSKRLCYKEGVVYVHFPELLDQSETMEWPTASITRAVTDITECLTKLPSYGNGINIYEFDSYEEALVYIKDYTETSSLAYAPS